MEAGEERTDVFRDRPDWSTNLGDLQRQMERFLEYLSAGKRPQFPISASPWQPAVDVAEGPEHLVVTVDIAGVDPNQMQILIEGNALTIRGTRRRQVAEQLVYHLMEIGVGPFERMVVLPRAVDADRADATYASGVLRIVLPKVPHATVGCRVLVRTSP
ncbi:MAG: Hsp20/alpha crystallin family protein [Chloroflexi bacterium]|nr:Hsp20/alpha crystallin family protein [Chloroflexota bacterium]